jgi:hypothetical protein
MGTKNARDYSPCHVSAMHGLELLSSCRDVAVEVRQVSEELDIDGVGLPLPPIDLLPTVPSLERGGTQQTAKNAAKILIEGQSGFVEPSSAERRALAVGFAMAGKILYGAAFDVVRVARPVDLASPAAIHANLDAITVFEIKSTNKASVKQDFRGYFFDLTTAELLVAQSLGAQYRFAFVNTISKAHVELSLTELFARARKIYPKWAVTF